MAIKRFGRPGVEISVFCGKALMMSRNSSSDPSMMERLMSVTDLVIDLKGSSCWASSWSQTPAMACLVLNTVVKLNGIRTWMYVEVAAYLPIFLKNSFGFAKSKFWALMSSGSGSGTVEPELILRRP